MKKNKLIQQNNKFLRQSLQLKRPQLRISISPRNLQIDERWMEFKIINKNIHPRSYHVAAIYKSTLFIQGGYDVQTGILGDFWKLQLQNKSQGFQWIRLKQKCQNYPGKLKAHTCLTYKNKLVIFGGQVHMDQNSNLTYIYNIENQKWEKIIPNIDIPKLQSHAAFIYQDKMFVYGGYIIAQAKYSNKIYCLDLKTYQWKLYFSPEIDNITPQPRGNVGLVQYKGDAWLFGGSNSINTLNDLWKFNIKGKTWGKIIQKQIIPQPRRNHSMILYKNHFFLFGGIQDVTKQKNDIYIYHPEINEWYKIHSSTNSVYQISPTLKNKRQLIKKKSPEKFDRLISLIPNNQSRHKQKRYQSNNSKKKPKTDIMKKVLDESRHKKFLQKKHLMLQQFEIQAKNQSKILSPTSENMLKTLQIIGDQDQTINYTYPQVSYDSSKRFILGKKPCARDAQAVELYNDQLLICGGDRHLMSFCDIYFFDLKKGLQSKLIYLKK